MSTSLDNSKYPYTLKTVSHNVVFVSMLKWAYLNFGVGFCRTGAGVLAEVPAEVKWVASHRWSSGDTIASTVEFQSRWQQITFMLQWGEYVV